MKMRLTQLLISMGLASGLILGTATQAFADAQSSDMVIYIDPVEYTNPINLWHPYTFFWLKVRSDLRKSIDVRCFAVWKSVVVGEA